MIGVNFVNEDGKECWPFDVPMQVPPQVGHFVHFAEPPDVKPFPEKGIVEVLHIAHEIKRGQSGEAQYYYVTTVREIKREPA